MTNENDFYNRMFSNKAILAACHYPDEARVSGTMAETIPAALFHVCQMLVDLDLPRVEAKVGEIRVLALRINAPDGSKHVVAIAHPVGHVIAKSAKRMLLRSLKPLRGAAKPAPVEGTPFAELAQAAKAEGRPIPWGIPLSGEAPDAGQRENSPRTDPPSTAVTIETETTHDEDDHPAVVLVL